MSIRTNKNMLNALALKANIFEDIRNSFNNTGLLDVDISEIGYISVLFDLNNNIINSSVQLNKEDNNTITEWAKYMKYGKITDKIYHLILSKGIFMFKKFKTKDVNKQELIVGGVIEINTNVDILTTIMQSKQMAKELNLKCQI